MHGCTETVIKPESSTKADGLIPKKFEELKIECPLPIEPCESHGRICDSAGQIYEYFCEIF